MTDPRDIATREDCELLVRTFYTRAFEDPTIGFVFTDVVELDLEAHVPRITDFWATVLLGAQAYSGSAFNPHVAVHAKVTLGAREFERWLQLWFGTVDDLFKGERANQAKIHALRVAQAFLQRLEGFPTPSSA